MAQQPASAQLQVGDAALEDVAEGRARMGRHVFDVLQLREGQLVRIIGMGEILAAAAPAAAEDEGLDVVRLDGSQRHRIGVRVGDTVEVRRYDTRSAERVRMVTLGSGGPAFVLSPDDVRSALDGLQVAVGDTFTVAPQRRDFRAEVSLLGLSVVEVAGSSAGAHAVLVRVVDTAPAGPVSVTDDTEIELVPAGAGDADRDES